MTDTTDPSEIYLTSGQIERCTAYCRGHAGGPLVQALTKKGDLALATGPFSVMDKAQTPPSGDKHDFLRMPTYAWPNPDTPDGLPYIFKDGQAGPHTGSSDYDMSRMNEFTAAVKNLSWAFLATQKETYAEHAALLLRTWFTDPGTRMNPNLTFSKYTPGDEPPYPTGVIATHSWVDLVQAITFLTTSTAWTDELAAGLRQWFNDYLAWLQTSPQGLAEKAFKNNRGTWYEAQLAAFARFAGNDILAQKVLKENCPPRLDHQVAPDGTLPEELRRTISLNYTLMTLKAWATLALMGEQLNVDLWHRTFDDNRGLHRALDYTGRYINGTETWPHQQIKPAKFDSVPFTYRAAARAYDDATLLKPVARLDNHTTETAPAAILFT